MAKTKKSGEPVDLGGTAVRHLRGLGHSLDPVVSIGKNGITGALVAQTERALLTHELVKVRVQGEAPVERREAGALLAAATGSALAQVLGRTFLLYKAHPEKPRIVLPAAKKKKRPAPPGGAPDDVRPREALHEDVGDGDD